MAKGGGTFDVSPVSAISSGTEPELLFSLAPKKSEYYSPPEVAVTGLDTEAKNKMAAIHVPIIPLKEISFKTKDGEIVVIGSGKNNHMVMSDLFTQIIHNFITYP